MNTPNGNSPYLTLPEIAHDLRLSRATVQRWCRQGKLPVAKIGKSWRIRRVDFDRWYESKLREPVVEV